MADRLRSKLRRFAQRPARFRSVRGPKITRLAKLGLRRFAGAAASPVGSPDPGGPLTPAWARARRLRRAEPAADGVWRTRAATSRHLLRRRLFGCLRATRRHTSRPHLRTATLYPFPAPPLEPCVAGLNDISGGSVGCPVRARASSSRQELRGGTARAPPRRRRGAASHVVGRARRRGDDRLDHGAAAVSVAAAGTGDFVGWPKRHTASAWLEPAREEVRRERLHALAVVRRRTLWGEHGVAATIASTLAPRPSRIKNTQNVFYAARGGAFFLRNLRVIYA